MEKTYKLLKLLIWVLAFAVVLAGASLLYNNLSARMEMPGLAAVGTEEPAAETATPGETRETQAPTAAPDFTVYDIDGNPHKLSDFRGKPVILNFWASWCGPCKMEMPDFDEKYGEYGDQVHFLMVNLTDGSQETVETASGFVAEQGYSFPVLFDTDRSGAIAYGVNAVPVTYFID